MASESNTTAGDSTSDYIRISLGKTRLLLPAGELVSIEDATHVRPPQKSHDVHGFITIENTDVPVYAFDDNLYLLPFTNNRRQVCVCLDNGQYRIGILCDNAGKIMMEDVKMHDLPDCMQSSDSIIRTVAENNNTLYCISKTADLLQLAGKPARE